MAQGEITSEIVKTLASYLKANGGLLECYESFPNPNQKLKYPSGSLAIGNPTYFPMQNYVVFKGDEITSGADQGKVPVRRVVGYYEFRLQLDLWCESKPARNAVYKTFFDSFHQNADNPGLSLQLTNYFNEWARYSIDSMEFVDTEEQAQRNEWRIRVSILADCKAIVAKNEFVFKTIENNLEISNAEIVPPEESGDVLSI